MAEATSNYRDLFQVFLHHTDQKFRAKRWLTEFTDRLTSRDLFVDAGAGEGTLTRELAKRFKRTTAIEPSAELREKLGAIEKVQVLPSTIGETTGVSGADFVLCSHVLYMIPQEEWETTALKMASWLSRVGVLAILLQSRHTDCNNLVENFTGRRMDLGHLLKQRQGFEAQGFEVDIDQVESHIDAPDIKTTRQIARFLLAHHTANEPSNEDLEKYIRRNYLQPSGNFQLSCHQDIFIVRRG